MWDNKNKDLICNGVSIAVILQQWTHRDYSILCIKLHHFALVLPDSGQCCIIGLNPILIKTCS